MGNRGPRLLLVGRLLLGEGGCSRTGMPMPDEVEDAGVEDAIVAEVLVDAAEDISVDSAIEDAAIDEGADVIADVQADVEPTACRLVAIGTPKTILSFTDRHATAPSIVTLAPGRPATIALQALASGGNSPLHSDIQLARVNVGAAWPSGAVIDRAPQLVGVETHGWGEMSRAQPPRNDLALAWHGDPGGIGRPMLRTFDPDSWTPGPLVDVAMRGEAVLALARGASIVGNAYSGSGYAIAWRDVDAMRTRPRLMVVDATGKPTMTPMEAAEPSNYPGPTPAVTWSGSQYVVAVSLGDCPPASCTPFSVLVRRLVPPTADGPARLEPRTTFPAPSGRMPFRPSLSRVEGAFDTFLVWGEGTSATSPRDIRLAWLDATGKSLRDITVAKDVRAIGAVVVSASALGVIVAWPETGDETLARTALGRDRIVIHHFDRALAPLSAPMTIPITRFNDYGRVSLAPLDRGILLAWGGAQPNGEVPQNDHDVSLLARLDCAEP